jgi:Pilus assembly protein, PilO
MKLNLTSEMRRTMRHWLPLLGWPGMLAMGLLAICLGFYLASIRPLQTRLDVVQHSADAARANIVNASATTHRGGDTPTEQLVEFYHFFPAEKDSPVWLDKLVKVAERNGLSLNEGEYKVTQDKVGQLMRYKIMLPVQGKYPQIRKFLASLPSEIPVVALENVQFERKNIVDTDVQAKIKLVLYLVQAS